MTSPSRSTIAVEPQYLEAKNAIVQPAHFVACSRYFVQKWMPRLGGTATCLVLFLRSRGYYNPHTGERRDQVQICREELSEAVGCSYPTIWRELQNNEALKQFVSVEQVAERGERGRLRQTKNIYHIAMDDPLVPEDLPTLEEILERRRQSEREKADLPAGKKRIVQQPARHESLSSPGYQFEMQVENAPAFQHAMPVEHAPVFQSETRSVDIPPEKTYSHKDSNIPAGPSPSDTPASDKDVVALLIDCGVSPRVARTLSQSHAEEAIRQQVAALRFRKPNDPAATLVQAIREKWAIPRAASEAETAARKRLEQSIINEDVRNEARCKREAEEQEKDAVENYWTSLPDDRKLEIDRQVLERLREENPFIAARLARNGVSPPIEAVLRTLRYRLLSQQMGSGGTVGT